MIWRLTLWAVQLLTAIFAAMAAVNGLNEWRHAPLPVDTWGHRALIDVVITAGFWSLGLLFTLMAVVFALLISLVAYVKRSQS